MSYSGVNLGIWKGDGHTRIRGALIVMEAYWMAGMKGAASTMNCQLKLKAVLIPVIGSPVLLVSRCMWSKTSQGPSV